MKTSLVYEAGSIVTQDPVIRADVLSEIVSVAHLAGIEAEIDPFFSLCGGVGPSAE